MYLKLLQETRNDFEIYITVSGNENKYAEYLYQKYKGVSCIKWLGKITREQVFEYYQQSDCLIFPSKLETWGLPISEAIQFGKPIIAADLPYAHETSMGYEKIHFFNPTNASHLATVMQQLMDKELVYSPNEFNRPQDPFCEDWNGLFKILF